MKTKSKPLPCSARDWQIYTNMPGVGAAAAKLSTALRTALKAEGATRESVRSAVVAVMAEERSFGACDSEPVRVLANVLDRKFGRGR